MGVNLWVSSCISEGLEGLLVVPFFWVFAGFYECLWLGYLCSFCFALLVFLLYNSYVLRDALHFL